MNREERIELIPAVLAGKPIAKSTHISVELVIERLADGWDEQTLLEQPSALKRDDIRACLYYASATLRGETVAPRHVQCGANNPLRVTPLRQDA